MIDLDYCSTDEELFESFKIRKRCESICNWILNERCSIRQCAEELMIPKSTVHKYIHTYIKYYYDEEYCQIQTILRWNKKYRRIRRRYRRGRP